VTPGARIGAHEIVSSRPAIEARSGIEPWAPRDLPVPPTPRGLGWLSVCGPGVIVLGLSIGSGEFLLGPAVFVRYGLTLLWVSLFAIVLQTIFNMEVMRYTLATGEPVFTGFMRTRPSSSFWAVVYTVLYLLQFGWPAFAATAAGAIFFLGMRHMPTPGDAPVIYGIGVALFLASAAVLSVGKRIVRTLEVLNWILVAVTLGGFLVMAVVFVPLWRWVEGVAGLVAFSPAVGTFMFLPPGGDLSLLAALVAYSGAGGVSNLVLSNWARDKGYGMASHAGYIASAIGGERVPLAHAGFRFDDGGEARRRWRGWWRIIRADQCAVFAAGAVLGMLLPAIIYVTFVPPGTDIQGLGISAALASSVGRTEGALMAGAIALLGAWILFKTQLDTFEGMTRAITDILWTGSTRVREAGRGDVRAIYYTVMILLVVWGVIALKLAPPFALLLISANVAGVIFVIASLHLLYVNTRLLPPHVRPPLWRRVALVGMSVFYATFATMSIAAALG
jgi:hypothetical protein